MSFGASLHEASGAAVKMRKPPLKARAFVAEEALPVRRSLTTQAKRQMPPGATTALAQRSVDDGSISSSSSPYDPVMSMYYSATDPRNHSNLSIQNSSALEGISAPMDLLNANSVRTSSMSELYFASEQSELRERSSGLRGTPLINTVPIEQPTFVIQKLHSNYTSSGTTFVTCNTESWTGGAQTQSQGAGYHGADSSTTSMIEPEPATNISFTRMAPRASHSRTDQSPPQIDDSVALSDSVRAMMTALSGTTPHEKTITINPDAFSREQTLFAIKGSVVYNSQGTHTQKAEGLGTISGDGIGPTSTKPNFAVSHNSCGSQIDIMQNSKPAEDILVTNIYSSEAASVPVSMPTDAIAAALPQKSSDFTTVSHRKASTLLPALSDNDTELKMSLTHPEGKELEALPSSPSTSRHLAENVSQGCTDRGAELLVPIRPSVANTYDYHDYTTIDDTRSEPVFSDLLMTKSNLIQLTNYTNLVQSNSDSPVPSTARSLSQRKLLGTTTSPGDYIELGMSEIVSHNELPQPGDEPQLFTNPTMQIADHSISSKPDLPAEKMVNDAAVTLRRSSNQSEQASDLPVKVNTSPEPVQDSTMKQFFHQVPVYPSVLPPIEAGRSVSPTLMQQFQLFQLFQQFQQFQQMHQMRNMQEAENFSSYVPPGPVLKTSIYQTQLKPNDFENPSTPVSNVRANAPRPSSAPSPYPGIESRVGGAPSDRTIKGTTQHIFRPNLGITESAIDIVNDVVNALDDQRGFGEAPSAQLDLHVTNLMSNSQTTEKSTANNDIEPSESFLTDRLKNISRLAGYRTTGQGGPVLQQATPKDITSSSVYKYMTTTQKSHFAGTTSADPIELLWSEDNKPSIKTYDDSCAFINGIEKSVAELQHMSHRDTLCLLKQVMLGAVQQHKLLEQYVVNTSKLQKELSNARQQNEVGLTLSRAGSPTGYPSQDLQIAALKVNLQKALSRNSTLLDKLEEYADRIKEYKRQEKKLLKMVENRPYNERRTPPQGPVMYRKVSPTPWS